MTLFFRILLTFVILTKDFDFSALVVKDRRVNAKVDLKYKNNQTNLIDTHQIREILKRGTIYNRKLT
jgi:hypothetical protein